ncbi:MAG TPA: hypothetical protein VK942_19825 [Actinomycetes bacterium]|nr:hypothetical protein [Actinomycetes bacterium]
MAVTARQVQPPEVGLVAALGEQHRRQCQAEDSHGDVDPEHPRPAERAGDHAAQEEPGDAAARRRGGPAAERTGALAALGKRRGQQRQGRRDGDRGAKALDGAGGHQHHRGAGQAAGQRGHGEQREPGGKQPPAAVQVGGPARQQQKAPEAQRIDARHPLEVMLGKAEVAADGGQGDDHDGDAEDVDELRHAQQGERCPSAGQVGARACRSCAGHGASDDMVDRFT